MIRNNNPQIVRPQVQHEPGGVWLPPEEPVQVMTAPKFQPVQYQQNIKQFIPPPDPRLQSIPPPRFIEVQ